jgi:hypothetical protein
VVLRSSTWLVDTPSLPHGRAEAEDRHSNFYDTWVNLLRAVDWTTSVRTRAKSARHRGRTGAASASSLAPADVSPVSITYPPVQVGIGTAARQLEKW